MGVLVRTTTVGLVLVVAVLLAASSMPARVDAASSPWYDSNWKYRKRITIDYTKVSGGANLSDFPVLVNITSDSNLASNARSDGYDILFTSSNASTKLSHQLELYTSATGALVAWVKVPTVSASANTTLFMYYGYPSASSQEDATTVWDSSYKAVWHLKESGNGTAGEFKDSTSNVNHGRGGGGTASQVPTQTSSGKMDGANSFDGTGDYIAVPRTASIAVTGDITVEAWVNLLSTPGSSWHKISYQKDKYEFGFYNNDKPRFKTRNNLGTYYEAASASGIGTAGWHHIAGVRSGNNTLLYVDGALSDTDTFAGTLGDNAAEGATLGGKSSGEFLNAIIDEVKISAAARSAGWIATEYANQNSPSTFYSLGIQQIYDWDSYSDSARTSPCPTFTYTYRTIYMKGTGLSDIQYRVAYFDANGVIRGPDTPTASGGTLLSSYLASTVPTAAAGTWHFLVQPASGYTSFEGRSYATIAAAPETYGLIADISAEVQAGAIPEFSTVVAGVSVAMVCFGVYVLLRRMRLRVT